MRSPLWRRVADAALNFARSPLPTLIVWLGDALGFTGVVIHALALEWRMKRQASRRAALWACFDAALICLAAFLIWGAV